MDEKVHNFTVWFKNGESRVFGFTESFYDETGVALKDIEGGVIFVDTDSISAFHDPTRKWRDNWSN